MKEYIEREAAINEFQVNCIDCLGLDCGDCWVKAAKEHIKEVPSTDVAPVRRGEWVLLDECSNEGVYCSICHKKVYKTEYANQKLKSKYCPNCGAKMDGGKNIDD